MSGVVRGITISAGSASRCAASATPCAWLPAEAVITPRCALGRASLGDLVVGAAQLEREHRLQILALEQDAVAEARRQLRRLVDGRLDRDIVDARLEDALDVGLRHGADSVRSKLASATHGKQRLRCAPAKALRL
jgi:hypothetical protein